MLGQLVVVAALVCMLALAAYLWWVPSGPACPRCGALARERRRGYPSGNRVGPLLDRALLAAECPVCGWEGRMRRRPPVGVVARARRGGRP